MKLTAVIFLAAFLNVSATGFSQKVSFSGKNVPIEKVFVECKKQTGYSFLYPSSLLNIAFPVTIDAKDLPLENFLKELFSGQPIGYEIRNRSILLFQKPLPPNSFNPKDVESIKIDNYPAMAFPLKIKVIDSLGMPMVRASVSVRNKKTSVVTDAEGIASLQVDIGDVIEISFVGYETTTHTVKDRSNVLFIRLRMSDKGMDEVTTGYTKLRKESFTGNSIRITQEQLLKVTNRNVISALQIFDPGFRLETNNIMGSDPNTMPEFYIRGRSGIGVKSLDQVDLSEAVLSKNPNLPIFFMDGYEIPIQRVYDFDITRIASVTILKDAAATAIYGSRAANGVVVITTVAPIPGKLRVQYNVLNSLSVPDLSNYNLMNAEEKLRAEELAGYYDFTGLAGYRVLEEFLAKKNQLLRGVNTDWISQPLRNAYSPKHTLSFDGGFEQLRFNATLKYDMLKGVMKGSQRETKGASLTIDYRLKKFQFRNDFMYDATLGTNSPYGNLSDYSNKNPYDEIYDENGKPQRNTKDWRGILTVYNLKNPIYEALTTQNFSTDGYNSFNNNTTVSWNPLRGLTFRTTIALNRSSTRADEFIDPLSGLQLFASPDPNKQGSLSIRRGESNTIYNTNTVNYVTNFGGHNLSVNALVDIKEDKRTQISEFYIGFPSGTLRSPNYATAMERKTTYVEETSRLFGTGVGINYTYKDIYLFDGSARLDGSSKYGTDRRFAPFWSLGAGINLHKYDFLKKNAVISRLKISGTYGITGKTEFSTNASRGTFEIQQSKYTTGTGVILQAMENPALTWEVTNKTDVIFDLGFFKDKVTLNVNWYEMLTKDLVNDIDLPLSAGFSQYKDNVGKIRNRGLEMSLQVEMIRKKDFYLSMFATWGMNKNTILELSNSLKAYNERVNQEYDGYREVNYNMQDPAIKKQYSTAHTKYVEGGSVTSVFGMRSLGINPADGKEIFMRPDGTITYAWAANDQVIIGDETPGSRGSFGLNASYKAFTFSSSFTYQFDVQSYNYTLLNKVENVDLYANNADRRVLEQRWQKPGDITPLRDIKERDFVTRPTSRFMQNNNNIICNSLSLGYTFKTAKIAKLGLSNLYMQLSSNQNVFTISSIRMERGLSSPFARNFELKIQVVL